MTIDKAPQDDATDEQACLVVAALADGESVEPEALKLALEDPSARAYLVDLMSLRREVGNMSELTTGRWRERQSFRSRLRWLSAAAAVLISLAAGYVAGQRTVQAASPPTVETVVHLEHLAPAPTPTRVIPLRPGVNWTETPGEQ